MRHARHLAPAARRSAAPAAARPRSACARSTPCCVEARQRLAPASPPTSAPKPLRSRSLCSASTRRRSSIDATPSSARRRLSAFGPRPWMRSSATTAGGCFCAQPLELGDLAGLDQLADLLGGALADALDLLQLLRRSACPRSDACAAIACAALSYARTRNDCGSPSSSMVSSASSRSMSSTSCLVSATPHVLPRAGATRATRRDHSADGESQVPPRAAARACVCARHARLRSHAARRAPHRAGLDRADDRRHPDRGGRPHLRRRRHRQVRHARGQRARRRARNHQRRPRALQPERRIDQLLAGAGAGSPGGDPVADARGRRRRAVPAGLGPRRPEARIGQHSSPARRAVTGSCSAATATRAATCPER